MLFGRKCVFCAPNYILDTSQMYCIDKNCQSYDFSSGLCQNCSFGLSFINGSCLVNHCATYSAGILSSCIKCLPGFSFKQANICVANNCASFLQNSISDCLLCS